MGYRGVGLSLVHIYHMCLVVTFTKIIFQNFQLSSEIVQRTHGPIKGEDFLKATPTSPSAKEVMSQYEIV